VKQIIVRSLVVALASSATVAVPVAYAQAQKALTLEARVAELERQQKAEVQLLKSLVDQQAKIGRDLYSHRH
jgi:hypothetical protein